MKRGDVWWVDFDPSLAGEIQKTRPAIIISNNFANNIMNRVQVIPLTNNTKKCYPSEAYVVIHGKQSKVMADQIATVSKIRLKSKIARITNHEILGIEEAMKIQLQLK